MRTKDGKYINYEMTLEKAGARIIAFKEFGSYQGTWLALVENNGETGIIEGSYGSCSGCDACQAEFDEWNQPIEKNGKYYKDYGDEEITEEEWNEYWKKFDEKVINFGALYLHQGMNTKEYYQNKLDKINAKNEDDWFSDEEKEYCEWAVNQNW